MWHFWSLCTEKIEGISFLVLKLGTASAQVEEDKGNAGSSKVPAEGDAPKKSGDDYLIDLTEMENLNSTTADENGAPAASSSASTARKMSAAEETFTTLALRTPTSVVNGESVCRSFDGTGASAFGSLDDSGEFTVPHGTDATE